MKRTVGGVLLILVLVAAARGADPEVVLHTRVSEVRLTLVATDREGRPWPELSVRNLRVTDDGQTVTDLQLRSTQDLPLRIGILLDVSDSTRRSWPAVRSALAESMGSIFRLGDQMLMMTFDSQIEMERVLGRPQELGEVLPGRSGGLTALYDSLYKGCEHPMFSGGADPRRSAVILFSDGEDNLSSHGLKDATEAAERNGIAIYTITIHNPKVWKLGDGVLRRVAVASGGRDFRVKNLPELRAALRTISEELRNSYLLYYRAPRDEGGDRFRQIEIAPVATDGLKLRSRAGYYTAP